MNPHGSVRAQAAATREHCETPYQPGGLAVLNRPTTDCDYCGTPTSNTPDHNPQDTLTACDNCLDTITWQQDHQAGECADAPLGVECTRDHDEEQRATLAELYFDIARDGDLDE